jgi:molybdopterin-guanine dinucleotide biosynthesis protein A
MSSGEPFTGVILAGGRSSRFGANKALSLIRGERLIERLARAMREVAPETLLVTNTPEAYAFLNMRMVGDLVSGCGPLGGIYTALKSIRTPLSLCVACDMPFVRPAFLRYMVEAAPGYEVVVPVSDHGEEPLCAVYHTRCLSVIEPRIQAGQYKITGFYDRVRVKRITTEETPLYDPWMLFNVNTREDYEEALKHLEEA